RPPSSPLFPYTTLFRSTRSTVLPLAGKSDGSTDCASSYSLSVCSVLMKSSGDNRDLPSWKYSHALWTWPLALYWRARSKYHGARSEEHTSELQSPDHLV